ncbi:type II secretion system F family protein [Candidatus Parcubacteria bacterium]|nr:MAG: type II secretion system F family protein [Candidatus Parcubacteria bacterium]
MLYHYVAADRGSKISEGDLDVGSLNEVIQFLASKGLRPLSVKPVKEAKLAARRFFGGITITDKIFLTKYLALMLKVGTDLLSAIDILIADFDKPSVKALLFEIRENLGKGQPFYTAFAQHPKTFSPTFINLIKAAETSGNLQQTFDDLSTSLSREADLRGRIRAALIYPVILLVASAAIVLFLTTFALPRIAKVFLDTGIDPPLFSRIVFGVGLFIGDHATVIVTTLFLAVGFSLYFFSRVEVGRRVFDQMLRNLPLIRKIYREAAIQRFAATMSSLLRAGLPMMQTIDVTADTVGSEEFRASLRRIAEEGLSKGLTLGEAFKREAVFPRIVTNLIAISEKAGHLEEVLRALDDFYSASVDSTVRSVVATLEPLLLMGMGLLVGTIAISIIIPIYQLTTQF